jgi:hypothetical protein
MDDLGGISAIAAGVTAVVAGILLAAFFATRNQTLGHANDAASAVMAILLMPAALAVLNRFADTGPLIVVVTAVGLAGMAGAAVASVLTAAGRMSVAQLSAWQGGSFLVLFLWVVGTSVTSLLWGRLPVGLGWLGIAAGLLVIVATAEILRLARRMGGLGALEKLERSPLVAMVSTLGAFTAFPIWCIWLGLNLTG